MICWPPGWSHLKAARKSKATLRTYEAGVALFLRFLAEEGLPAELTKPHVMAWLASMSRVPARHRVDPADGRQAVRVMAGR